MIYNRLDSRLLYPQKRALRMVSIDKENADVNVDPMLTCVWITRS